LWTQRFVTYIAIATLKKRISVNMEVGDYEEGLCFIAEEGLIKKRGAGWAAEDKRS
jgi:hypothetical protein